MCLCIVCVSVCVCVSVHCVCICMCVCVSVHCVCICMCVCVHMCVCVCITQLLLSQVVMATVGLAYLHLRCATSRDVSQGSTPRHIPSWNSSPTTAPRRVGTSCSPPHPQRADKTVLSWLIRRNRSFTRQSSRLRL